MLTGGTVLIAAEAELVSDAVTATAMQLHVSPVSLGVIVLALVVAPLLVLVSWPIGHPMNLAFDPLHLFAIAGTAFIVRAITADGETNRFEGMLLVGVCLLLGLAFFVGSA